MMNIVVESNIPFIQGQLEPYGRVSYLPAGQIDADAVRDADALFVRTRTQCDAALLQDSCCRFVATATIGTDHIDLPWCEAHGIEVANAPGCNAPAVAQYVFASLGALANRPLSQYTIGIVGVGHVGSIVERWARQMDMRVLVNDPPRERAEGGDGWSTLADIAREADIITFHTPLDATTHHLAGKALFDSLQRSPIIINAARGAVVDNAALADALADGRVHHAVIDCWEGEPQIDRRLLEMCTVATPHIAGYSYEGKVRGTRMVLDRFREKFADQGALMPAAGLPEVPQGAARSVNITAVMRSYDPLADTARLKGDPAAFEELRNHYDLRHEVPDAKID